MDLSPVTASGTSTASASTAASTNQLDKNAFLKLLTAQLANQDPLQPVDNQAFIAQLAQFSSLEQLQNVGSKLDSLLSATTSSTQVSTAGLVGKTVGFKADGTDIVQGGAVSPMTVNLSARATVTAVVQDASGATVRTLALGAHDAGAFDLGWDGRDAGGNTLPAGHYTVTLSAKDASGADVDVSASAQGMVRGVTFDGSTAALLVGGATVKLSDVTQITQS